MSFEQTRKQQILEFLKNSLRLAFKPKEIADTLKIPRSSVRRELQSLIKPDRKTGEPPKVRKFLPKDHTTRGIYSYIEEEEKKTYRRYIIKSKIYCNNKAEDIQAHTFVDSDSNYNEDEIRTALLETVLVFLQSKEDLCGGGGMFDKSETGDLSIYNIKNHFGFDSPDETDSYDVLYPEIDVS